MRREQNKDKKPRTILTQSLPIELQRLLDHIAHPRRLERVHTEREQICARGESSSLGSTHGRGDSVNDELFQLWLLQVQLGLPGAVLEPIVDAVNERLELGVAGGTEDG